MSTIDQIQINNNIYDIKDNDLLNGKINLPLNFYMNDIQYGWMFRVDDDTSSTPTHLTQLRLYDYHYQYDTTNGFNNGSATISNGIYFYNDNQWISRFHNYVDAGKIKGGVGAGISAQGIGTNKTRNIFYLAETLDEKPYYGITNPAAFRRDIRNTETWKEINLTGNSDYFATNANTILATLKLKPGTWIVNAQTRFVEGDNTAGRGVRVMKIFVEGIGETKDDSPISTQTFYTNGSAYLNTQRLVNIPRPNDSADWDIETNVHLVVYQTSNSQMRCNVRKMNAVMI